MMQLHDELESQNGAFLSYRKGCARMAVILKKMNPTSPPDNYVDIVEDAVDKFDHPMTPEGLLFRLYSGVLLIRQWEKGNF